MSGHPVIVVVRQNGAPDRKSSELTSSRTIGEVRRTLGLGSSHELRLFGRGRPARDHEALRAFYSPSTSGDVDTVVLMAIPAPPGGGGSPGPAGASSEAASSFTQRSSSTQQDHHQYHQQQHFHYASAQQQQQQEQGHFEHDPRRHYTPAFGAPVGNSGPQLGSVVSMRTLTGGLLALAWLSVFSASRRSFDRTSLVLLGMLSLIWCVAFIWATDNSAARQAQGQQTTATPDSAAASTNPPSARE